MSEPSRSVLEAVVPAGHEGERLDRVPLSHGVEVSLGDTRLRFEISDP